MQIGIVGLGVMGRNLALNFADNGIDVIGFDGDAAARDAFEARDPKARVAMAGIRAVESLQALIGALPMPRALLLMVPAGDAVDEVLLRLSELAASGDVVVDGGNSNYRDTMRRQQVAAASGISLLGLGVSGGEEGARHGPCLMLGGNDEACQRVAPMLQPIAAKVDGEPCAARVGDGGAGHFVKMVHNGIEYAVMQLIAEAYLLLVRSGLDSRAAGAVFQEWNKGALESYLIEITGRVLQLSDRRTGQPMVDVIEDSAAQKGTGRWTAIEAMEMGVPIPTIIAAVTARSASARKDERRIVHELIGAGPGSPPIGPDGLAGTLEQALLAANFLVYEQGFRLLAAASTQYGWKLDFASIARIWRGGCIIRASLLNDIAAAFDRQPKLPTLLGDGPISHRVAGTLSQLRTTVGFAAEAGVPAPAFSSALAHADAFSSPAVGAALVQAQRDYFGRHGFRRIDLDGVHHLDDREPA